LSSSSLGGHSMAVVLTTFAIVMKDQANVNVRTVHTDFDLRKINEEASINNKQRKTDREAVSARLDVDLWRFGGRYS
jgi:hypothetical protein